MIRPLAALTDGPAGWRVCLAALFAGAVAATGQAPLFWWPLALAGFVGLIALTLPRATAKQAAKVMWFGGAGYFIAALNWIVQPFMIDVARHGWMAPFALGGMAFGLALFWGAAAGLAARLSPDHMGRRAIALTALLTGAELLRGYVFTGFPWAEIGHLWIGTPVMQLAAIAGPAGLTALTIGTVALTVASGRKGAFVAAAIIGAVWVAGVVRVPDRTEANADAATVRLLQPNAAQREKWQADLIPVFFRRQLEMTAEAGDPDLIVWPETAVAYTLNSAGPVLDVISQVAGDRMVALGIQRRVDEDFYNSLVTLDAGGTVSQIYDKFHLVPFGEYMPLTWLFEKIEVFGLATLGYGYSAGEGPVLLDFGAAGRALPLICYEMIFPRHLRGLPTRPDWVLQITNDAWFGTFSGPYQHLAQARLRAVESGLPILRSANTGVSAVIDPYGRVLTSLPLNTSGQITAPIPAAISQPIYAKLGDFPILAIILVVLFGLRSNQRRIRR